jgi:predicted RNA-binding Zn ribbon-like protein
MPASGTSVLPPFGFAGASTVAGHVALDFANTVAWRLRDEPRERLPTYAALVAWAVGREVLSREHGERLVRGAARQPERAARALARARRLREAIFEVGAALAHGRAPGAGAVEALHAHRVEALAAASLVPAGGAWRVSWDPGATRASGVKLDHGWWPVAVAAAALLESRDLGRLRMCAADGCGWLFLDRSRNGSRRWCSSDDCGNRVRVRRFRTRRRGSAAR